MGSIKEEWRRAWILVKSLDVFILEGHMTKSKARPEGEALENRGPESRLSMLKSLDITASKRNRCERGALAFRVVLSYGQMPCRP